VPSEVRSKTVDHFEPGPPFYFSRSWAKQRGLDWQATSRGLTLERGVNNVGRVSQHTLAGMAARGIVLVAEVRRPRALNESDLTSAHHIVAVSRAVEPAGMSLA